MSIMIKYFGSVAEQTGTPKEFIALKESGIGLADLKSLCCEKYNITDIDSVQTAINHELKETGFLKSGDEVAFILHLLADNGKSK